MAARAPEVIERAHLDELLAALRRRGYTVVGPQVRSARSSTTSSTRPPSCRPAGSTCRRAAPTGSSAATTRRCSRHNVGPDSWKRFLFPPVLRVWRARRGADGALEVEDAEPPPRYAFIGVRSCDLHAIAIQDRVFLGDRYVDPDYEARRARRVLRRRQLRPAGGTCFCVSMDTGPRVTARLRPRAHRAARRAAATASSSRSAASAAPRCSPSCAHRPADGGRAPARPSASSSDGRRRWAAASTPPDIRELLQAQRRAPALGRGRRPLPDLRQLHDGLPHLLLPARSRT